VWCRHLADRGIQKVEAPIDAKRCDVTRDAAAGSVLVDHDKGAGFFQGGEDGVLVHRLKAPKVEDFRLDPFRCEMSGCLLAGADGPADPHERYVGSLAHDRCPPQLGDIVTFWNLSGLVHQ
jgi:hypothetical protein